MRKFSTSDFREKKIQKQKITMLTAYDFHSALTCDRNGIDTILVGDSLGQMIQGDQDNRSVTITEMMYHTRLVCKGVRLSYVVADMPFGSYETPEQAIESAKILTEEGGANAVLMEGREVTDSVQAVVEAGIPVVGLVGMSVDRIQELGPYSSSSSKPKEEYEKILSSASVLEEAGCSALVLRTIPASLAKTITRRLEIPTIGIGAGRHVDGQLLLYHDMMGIIDDFNPRHVKRYAHVSQVMIQGVKSYISDVEKIVYPGDDYNY